MVTDKNYNDTAKRVYAVEFGKENYTVKKGYTFQSNNQTFQVLIAEDNTDNGMQAMVIIICEHIVSKMKVRFFCVLPLFIK
ncbi:hypothetical protein [Streptococcus loxodontisalivarius]|uniref:Uncharacterized protein n=1 Tax=Streptococcus loxodontisalivarius TaxID=1349415 RepID=A0ABS2PT62_9STRE|nr:hypothetical protein [Streptococcus loxodontisalivarius]MBM7642750.1 hypothetical protein [Streptococcus loxodontisalivarius]